MPAQINGMIGVQQPNKSALHIIAGEISPDYVKAFAKEHEDAGFDRVLVGYNAPSAEGFQVAAFAAAHTEKLSYLIAHRPGLVAPTLAARASATLDQFSNGRLALHIISGLSDADMAMEGDFTDKEFRYRRAAEYLDVMRKIWTATEPFDYDGQFYKLKKAFSAVKPAQKPHVPLFFGGTSPGALDMGAEHCDVYAIYGEPLKEVGEVIAKFDAHAGRFGKKPKYNMSIRPIIADTEGKAWDKAHKILAEIEAQNLARKPHDGGAARLMQVAERGDVHDERLWMGIAKVSGARGNASCLVGTPRQVADAILKYYRLGVESFLIRGFDPLNDTTDFGRELIPTIKQGALEIDREQTKKSASA